MDKPNGFYLEEGIFDIFTKDFIDSFIDSSMDLKVNMLVQGDYAICSNRVGDYLFITYSNVGE